MASAISEFFGFPARFPFHFSTRHNIITSGTYCPYPVNINKMALRAYSGTKIVAAAKNYAKHKVEMGGTAAKLEKPVVFLKPNSSVIAQGAAIHLPPGIGVVHHEVELGVEIGKRCKYAKAADWRSFVSGYCLALDMTARDMQAEAKKAGMPWTTGKCYDTFTPLSGMLEASRIADPHALELWLTVDGTERQRGSTADMLAKIPELIEAISAIMTLEPGDVILTGTPEGVGPVTGGQRVRAGITGLIEMEFPVVQEERR